MPIGEAFRFHDIKVQVSEGAGLSAVCVPQTLPELLIVFAVCPEKEKFIVYINTVVSNNPNQWRTKVVFNGRHIFIPLAMNSTVRAHSLKKRLNIQRW